MSSTPPSTPPSLPPTPTTPTNNTLSDIFSDSPPPSPSAPTPNPSTREPSDLPRLRSTHITAGYRSGITISKPHSLQPGFDSGYSLGACFGLRIGTLIGTLEGLWACAEDRHEKERRGKLVRQAREELAVERVFGRKYWEEGGWRYEVVVGEGGEVTWMEVVGGHPVVGGWEKRVGGEVERGGVRRGVFEGEEWEGGRVGGEG